MKEKNTPEIETTIVVESNQQQEPTKVKRERPYIHLEDSQIQELISTYRKLLNIENAKEKDLLIEKIETLEKELRFRNKLLTKKS